MADHFERNQKLINIDLGGNQLNHSTTQKIKSICQKNRNLKKVQEVAPLKEEIIRLQEEKVSNFNPHLCLGLIIFCFC
jgi:hypothetical protein